MRKGQFSLGKVKIDTEKGLRNPEVRRTEQTDYALLENHEMWKYVSRVAMHGFN